jgi:hypothetical protein
LATISTFVESKPFYRCRKELPVAISLRLAQTFVAGIISATVASAALSQEAQTSRLPAPAGAPAAAAPKLPDTPAGRTFGLYLEALNSGDRAKLLSFLKEHYPSSDAEAQANQIGDVRQRSGGFDVIRVEDYSTASKLVVRVKARAAGNQFTHMLEVSPVAPHGIALIGIGGAEMDLSDWAKR